MTRFSVTSAFLVLALAACSVSTDTGSTPVAGSFALVSVDALQLPVVETETATQVKTLLNGYVSLQTNLSFMQVLNYRVTSKADGSVQTSQTVRNGTFVMQGKVITFLVPKFSGDSQATGWSGTVSGDALIFSDPVTGKVAVYQRQ